MYQTNTLYTLKLQKMALATECKLGESQILKSLHRTLKLSHQSLPLTCFILKSTYHYVTFI